ncbi:MAG: hypothetical protein OWU84_06235 [Firmicutes bacterium]|nr:hypothetical protein [Bacillota bacterium]
MTAQAVAYVWDPDDAYCALLIRTLSAFGVTAKKVAAADLSPSLPSAVRWLFADFGFTRPYLESCSRFPLTLVVMSWDAEVEGALRAWLPTAVFWRKDWIKEPDRLANIVEPPGSTR